MILFILASLSLGCQASNYADLLANLQYIYNIEQLQKSMPVSDYYPDETYDKLQDDWDVAYPDTAPYSEPSLKEARDYGEAALRDQEYMKQLPLSGYQFISGRWQLDVHRIWGFVCVCLCVCLRVCVKEMRCWISLIKKN